MERIRGKSGLWKLAGLLVLACVLLFASAREARAEDANAHNFSNYEELLEALESTDSSDEASVYYMPSEEEFGWPSAETAIDLGDRNLFLYADWEIPANVTITSGSTRWYFSNKLTLKGTLLLTGNATLENICVANGGTLNCQGTLKVQGGLAGTSGGTTLTVESGGTVCLEKVMYVFENSIIDLQGGTIETTNDGSVAIWLRGGEIQSAGGSILCGIRGQDADSTISGSLTCTGTIAASGVKLSLDGTLTGVKRFSCSDLDSSSGELVVPSRKTLNVNGEEGVLTSVSGNGSFTVESDAVLNLAGSQSGLYVKESSGDMALTVNGTVNFNESYLDMGAGTSLAGSGKLTGNGTVYLVGTQNSDGTYSDVATISSDLKKNRDSTVLLVIDGNNLASFATVTVASSKTYTGSAIKPTVKVTVGGTTLTKGTDYTVSYADNITVGTATVTVTGKGDYNGTATATFKIKAQTTDKATVKSASYNSLKITWEKVTGASGYYVYRSTTKSSGYKKVKTITKGSTLTYTDKSLTAGKTYYYKIKAYRTSGTTKTVVATSEVASGKPVPATPTVKLTAGTKAVTVKVSKKVSGASGYVVYRSTKKSSGYKKIKTVTSGKAFTWKNTGLKAKTTYYYKVRAYRTVSGKKVYSSYSAVVSKKTK